MSGYVPKIVHETTFEGDAVRVEMLPMTKAAFGKIVNMHSSVGGDPGAVDRSRSYGLMTDILDDHVEKITGVRDANGDAVSKETVLDSMYFFSLVSEMFETLVGEAGIAKKSLSDSEERSLGATGVEESPQISESED